MKYCLKGRRSIIFLVSCYCCDSNIEMSFLHYTGNIGTAVFYSAAAPRPCPRNPPGEHLCIILVRLGAWKGTWSWPGTSSRSAPVASIV